VEQSGVTVDEMKLTRRTANVQGNIIRASKEYARVKVQIGIDINVGTTERN
jgi:hypothetical protein